MSLPKCECGRPITLCDRLNCSQSTFNHNPPPMTPNDKLPEEIADKINTEADKYGFVVPYDGSNNFYIEDKVKGYQAGATAWAGWKVRHDELQATIEDKIDKALHAERNATQAKMTEMEVGYLKQIHGLADALEQIAKEANNSPEDTWGEIAVRMKRIAIIQLQQFKDGKGKESVVGKCVKCGRHYPHANESGICNKCGNGKEVKNGIH